MGVTDLWPILGDLCDRKPLTYLSGKRVAVDLSCWVVQACLCKGLNASKSPYLRNLFFRVSRLLQLGVFPIFVMEGELTSLKESTVKERCAGRYSAKNSSSAVTRCMFDRTLKQCQDLLHTLGVPCIKSKGEGEAMCAFLCLNGIVDGVITEDNDAFLYGADVVFRDFSVDPNDAHVNVYDLKSTKNKFSLDRRKLVAIALLLGCDYSKGVYGIGKDKVLKFLEESKHDDILKRFEDWKELSESELFPQLASNCAKKAHCNRCRHLGSNAKHKKGGCSMCDSQFTCYLPSEKSKPCQCPWHLNEELADKWKAEIKIYNAVKKCSDFPDKKVIQEYLQFEDTIPSGEVLQWKQPNLISFQERAFNHLNWTLETCNQKFLPIIISWQLYQLKNGLKDPSSFIYQPSKILKHRTLRAIDYYEVCWTVINATEGVPSDDLITLEHSEYFSECYLDVVTDFHDSQTALKETKQPKARRKRGQEAITSKKVLPDPVLTDCPNLIFSPTPPRTHKQSSFRDSFDDFLEMPLLERVKAIPKVVSWTWYSPVNPLNHSKNKENVSVYFDKESDTCSILSPAAVNCLSSSLEFNHKKSFETVSNILSYEEAAVGADPSQHFIDFASENLNRDLLCLNFSESDTSILCDKKSQNLSTSECSFSTILKRGLEIHSTPAETFSRSRLYSFTVATKPSPLFPESPLTSVENLRPCLLFSINTTPSDSGDKKCLDPFNSEILSGKTPGLSNEILSTPKPMKSASCSVFSPLIFDSSADISLQ